VVLPCQSEDHCATSLHDEHKFEPQSNKEHHLCINQQRNSIHSDSDGDLQALNLIQVDIGGHPPIATGSSCFFLIQHVFLYCIIIVRSTLLGLFEASHILQVDTGGLSPNTTGLFCMFSCKHILLYFQRAIMHLKWRPYAKIMTLGS
jgi:hypothetical protein